MSTVNDDLQQYFNRMRTLCQQERTAEVEQSSLLLSACSPKLLEQKGLALLGLGVSNVQVGLGGKSLIELERPSAYHTSSNFPPHTFRPGDIARIEANVVGAAGKRAVKSSKKPTADPGNSLDQAAVEGVIYKVSDVRIIVSTETELQDVELPERVKLANSVTFDRMDRAIDSLERLVTQPSANVPAGAALALPLAQTLLAAKPLQPITPLPPDFCFKDECLNESQQEAVKFAIQSPEIALVGEINSTVLDHLQSIKLLDSWPTRTRDKRVLVCGASNLAVDNLLERLVPHEIPLTRIGHPARVMGNLHHETLDAQAARSDQAALAADVKSELESAMTSLTSKGKGRLKGTERKKMWEEVKELRKE
ncbi:hypothetical protein FRC10_007959 [Ceratobasidium sp. 414]|nr:hypothetical protein FRC10_007959 [Ceratobasidium sp. 414]